MTKDWKRGLLFAVVLAFVAALVFTGTNLLLGAALGPAKTAVQGDATITKAGASPPGVGPETIADIVDRAGPAVVKIDTLVVSPDTRWDPFFNDPFFREFFGQQLVPRQRLEPGLGSGFIISEDGYILTNEHVIDQAREIKVTVKGFEQPFPARVVGADYDLDLAVLKIEAPQKLPVLNLGDSDRVRVGDWVIAIGNPYGLDHTVTVGVISATGRPVTVEGRRYKNLLQTDASINPGNSGGPLLNLQGEVVGINTAVNVKAQGIGFAIPTSTVKAVLNDLIQNGRIVRPWLGVQVGPVDEEVARRLGLPAAEGALVVGVVPGSPAQRAGIRQYDVFVEFNGRGIKTPDDLVNAIRETRVGETATAVIYRNGQRLQVSLAVNERPAAWRG
ncbi:MAG: S1C family serine protease [Desulfotomaculales bacterium]